MRHSHLVAAFSAVVVFSFTQACGGRQPTRCMTSSDCGPGQVCSAGTCQTPLFDAGSGGSGGGGFFLFDGGGGGGDAGGSAAGGTAGGATSGCNPQNCAAGCCDMNGVCQGGTTRTACGIGGAACVVCGPGRICQTGVCASPMGGGSAGGGTGGGTVACGPTTCASGCCDTTGLCVAGTTNQACGTGGIVCIGCLSGNVCSAGSCVPNTAGGSAAGGSAAGGSAAGGSAAGGSAAGGSAAGGSAAGGSAAGGSAAGGSAAGGSAAGGSAAGGSAGGSTAGGSAGGGSAGGSTAGGSAGGAALPGDVCATADAITGGSVSSPMQVNGTTVGYANDYTSVNQTNCVGTGGRDRAYSVSLAPNQRVLASIRQATTGLYDPSLNVVVGPESECSANPRVCVAGDDLGSSSTVNAVRYLNTSGGMQTIFLLADSFSSGDSGGTFRLDVSVDTPAMGDSCESPVSLMSGTPRAGEALSGFANDYFPTSRSNGSTCSATSTGVDRAYSVLVGAGETLTVSVTPSTGLDTAINLHGDAAECASRTCLTSSNTGAAGALDTLLWTNTGTAARTMLVVVETPPGASGTYTINTTTGTLPGDTCATTAPPITSPRTEASQSLAGYANDYGQPTFANGCENASGPDRVYAVTVPARQRLVTTVTPTSGLDPVVNFVSGTAAACTAMPLVCSASSDNGASGTVETTVWDNGTTSPQSVFVLVHGASSTSSTGTFSFNVNFTTGDHCRSPTVVAGPYPRAYASESFTGYRKDILNGSSVAPCRYYTGPDRVYQVTLPAAGLPDGGMPGRMDFSATSSTMDLVLNVYGPESACTANPSVCFHAADNTLSGAESLAVVNRNAVPVNVFVGVSSYSSASGTYSVSVNVQ